ncbi:MAG TPA: FAD-linked oxidase C-terminal domain-containing protein [Chthoniobacterales bacterium]|nr:FAD-linked oxidase C-terminal domain-containing protein [Chthoniobacterales bacterium]
MTSPGLTDFQRLAAELQGALHFDAAMRALYATDASVYRELPQAVALPKTEEDIGKLVRFAREHGTSLIPRTAGTSLAGQVVGAGIVVDVSHHFTRVLEIDPYQHRVRVQPGVVRNELNLALAPHNMFFAPETSTQNRCMIGGMVGNNACGANSLVYGSTRDHLISARAVLSDGSTAEFGPLSSEEFEAKCSGDTLEASIYRETKRLLADAGNRAEIARQFPKRSIHRRNTGYALDLLAECAPFTPGGPPFNLCRLLAGSEGTLAFLTEITLACEPLPPPVSALVCVHCGTIDEALRANIVALRHAPRACELLDHNILECTKANLEQRQNRFFVKGDPGAILAVELAGATREAVAAAAARLESEFRAAGVGYHYPVVWGSDQNRVWNLRKAALGLLSNLPGDAKPVAVIEDTAIDPEDLPAFVQQFDTILAGHGLSAVHYAHAGSGELHLRPILNLKDKEHRSLFRIVGTEIARLVKHYGGSLSGEHGDGRLRGEFLPMMVGEKNYALFRAVKRAWDPSGILNPGKITDTPPMDASLRYEPNQTLREFKTVLRFSEARGILRAAEQCNGSGDCRKSHLMGGTMCPSYMATRNERDTTRARANILREVLTRSTKANPFDSDEIGLVMDLCLSCKGCKSECPSNVDVARLKAEWLQQLYDARGIPMRARLIGSFSSAMALASFAPGVFNFLVTNPATASLFKRFAGFAPGRSIPRLNKIPLRRWHRLNANKKGPFQNGRVFLFCDEFVNFNDENVGIKTVRLLNRLGYEVVIPNHVDSGRAQISKGLLRDAQRLAIRNVELLKDVVSSETPIVGIEPSAVLGFRDEVPDLVPEHLVTAANALAKNAFLIEEFIAREAERGRIRRDAFTKETRAIRLHGHCHQKSVASLAPAVRALELPVNYKVQVIPSGCCGMAGSFGYEREHFDLSMKIFGLVLMPAVRSAPADTVIAASGTSCRHQIKDCTGRVAYHPAEILHDALGT